MRAGQGWHNVVRAGVVGMVARMVRFVMRAEPWVHKRSRDRFTELIDKDNNVRRCCSDDINLCDNGALFMELLVVV